MVTGSQLGRVVRGVSRREVGWRQEEWRAPLTLSLPNLPGIWMGFVPCIHLQIPMHAYDKPDLSHTTVSKEDPESTH